MTELEGAVMSVSISLCEGVEWVTELEEAAMIVSISLCEGGVEWVTELEEATRVFPYLCVKEWSG